MNYAEELKRLIDEHVKNACEENLARICKMKQSETGQENVKQMIFDQCASTGCSVQYAMAVIDSELTDD